MCGEPRFVSSDSRNCSPGRGVCLPSLGFLNMVSRMARLCSLLGFAFLLCTVSLQAAEPTTIDPILLKPLPNGLVMHARIVDPVRMEGHPLVQRLVKLIETSQAEELHH